MVNRKGRQRKNTRSIWAVPKRLKGKLSITKYFQTIKEGDKVVFKASPSVHSGLYGRRFHGRTGSVIKINPRTCEVAIQDKHKLKTIIVNPIHLVKVENGTKSA